MATAFYARVTRDDDESLSVKNQVAEYREIAQKRGWVTLDFIEQGLHNKGEWSEKKRPKLFQLLEAVRAGKVCRSKTQPIFSTSTACGASPA